MATPEEINLEVEIYSAQDEAEFTAWMDIQLQEVEILLDKQDEIIN